MDHFLLLLTLRIVNFCFSGGEGGRHRQSDVLLFRALVFFFHVKKLSVNDPKSHTKDVRKKRLTSCCRLFFGSCLLFIELTLLWTEKFHSICHINLHCKVEMWSAKLAFRKTSSDNFSHLRNFFLSETFLTCHCHCCA